MIPAANYKNTRRPDQVDKLLRDVLITFTHTLVACKMDTTPIWENTIFVPSDFDRIAKLKKRAEDGAPMYIGFLEIDGEITKRQFKDTTKIGKP